MNYPFLGDVEVLLAVLVIFAGIAGVMWAFGVFDEPEGEWVLEWEQAKATPTARWISESGTRDIDEYLAMDVDRIRIGRQNANDQS
jgi:hypothetical protein